MTRLKAYILGAICASLVGGLGYVWYDANNDANNSHVEMDFDGIYKIVSEDLLNERKEGRDIRVLMVHGMGHHCLGYAENFFGNLVEQLKTVANSTVTRISPAVDLSYDCRVDDFDTLAVFREKHKSLLDSQEEACNEYNSAGSGEIYCLQLSFEEKNSEYFGSRSGFVRLSNYEVSSPATFKGRPLLTKNKLYFYEVTWDPATRIFKNSRLSDEFGNSTVQDRGVIADMIKPSLISDALADPVLYLGERRQIIKLQVIKALCLLVIDRPKLLKKPCDFALLRDAKGMLLRDKNGDTIKSLDLGAGQLKEFFQKNQIVVVTHSLGSFIVFDVYRTLMKLLRRAQLQEFEEFKFKPGSTFRREDVDNLKAKIKVYCSSNPRIIGELDPEAIKNDPEVNYYMKVFDYAGSLDAPKTGTKTPMKDPEKIQRARIALMRALMAGDQLFMLANQLPLLELGLNSIPQSTLRLDTRIAATQKCILASILEMKKLFVKGELKVVRELLEKARNDDDDAIVRALIDTHQAKQTDNKFLQERIRNVEFVLKTIREDELKKQQRMKNRAIAKNADAKMAPTKHENSSRNSKSIWTKFMNVLNYWKKSNPRTVVAVLKPAPLRQLEVVGFTDVDDILSFWSPNERFGVRNVFVRNQADIFFGLFRDPAAAHSNYFQNADVLKFIVCGGSATHNAPACPNN